MIPFAKDAMTAWPQVADWLDEALGKTDSLMSVEDLQRSVRNGVMRLWLIHRDDRVVAAFVTEIVRGSRGGAVHVVALGGDRMNDWIEEVVESLEAYSRANECKYVVEMGRPGWSRVLERLGWTAGPSLMMKVTR
jgi:hypothetical protein